VTSSQVLAATPQAAASRSSLLPTIDDAEVRAGQRLRHRVFAGGLGATLHSRARFSEDQTLWDSLTRVLHEPARPAT
jgi:putative hemolysin